jgi:hypothetical protein
LAIPQKRRKWIAFALFFIVALISLLVAIEQTGILKKMPTPEIVVVNTVSGNITKLQETGAVNEVFESLYDNGIVSVNFTIHAWTYSVNYTLVSDVLLFGVYSNANTNLGFIHSVNINFSRTDNNSKANPIEDYTKLDSYSLVQAENLNIWRFDSHSSSTSECHIMAKGINRPNATFLRVVAEWYFYDKEANHWTTITLETTIFNGTDYIKTVMPIQLQVLAS